ncbi:hypothetical protein Ancab_021915 [Ancistrocladus abbreviatus]
MNMYYLDSRYFLLPFMPTIVKAVSGRWSAITTNLPVNPAALSNSAGAGGLDLNTIMNMMLLAVLLLGFLLTSVQVPLTAACPPFPFRILSGQFLFSFTLSFCFSLFCPSTLFQYFYPFIILLSLHSDDRRDIVFNLIIRAVQWLEKVLPGVDIISIRSASTSTSSRMESLAGEEDENNQTTYPSKAEQQVRN